MVSKVRRTRRNACPRRRGGVIPTWHADEARLLVHADFHSPLDAGYVGVATRLVGTLVVAAVSTDLSHLDYPLLALVEGDVGGVVYGTWRLPSDILLAESFESQHLG